MARLLPSKYQDRVASPRQNMPSARAVSQAMHEDKGEGEGEMSLMMMQWGQFVDHDLTFTPVHRGFNDTALECGECEAEHPGCLPIPAPRQDPLARSRSQNCLPFTR